MSTILFLIASILVALWCVPDAHAGAVISRPLYLGLEQGLVGYWSFEGKTISGTRVFDASGNGNYGTMTNGPTLVNGKLGQALQFDGSDDSVLIGDSTSLDTLTTNFTLSAWIKRSGSFNNDLIYQSGTQTNYWALEFQPSLGNSLTFFERSIDDDAANTPVVDSEWHHIAVVKNGDSGNNLVFYLDGKFDGTGSAGSVSTPSGTKRIGGWSEGGNSHVFGGNIDDLRLYNRALNADEIKRLYKIGATAKLGIAANNDSLQKGLVGWWTFDGKDISGVQAYDRSGNGNRGTMTNGPRLVSGKLGQGMGFDGVNDYVDIGTGPNLANKSFTIAAWIKRQVINGTEDAIFGQGSGSQNNALIIEFRESNVFTCAFFSNDLDTVAAYTDKDWHHWICVYDADTNQRRILRDGVQVASDISAADYGGSGNTSIGDRIVAGTQPFGGLIDDFRIYNRALSPDEIKRLYNMGR
jgi:Concanavalin A-like lectin/glucanases superfamily